MPCCFEQRAHDFADAAVTDDDRVVLGAGRPRHQLAGCGAVGAQPCGEAPAANDSSGVSTIVTEVNASVKLATRGSISPAAAAMPMPTKANSPPGPSNRPVSTATGHDRRNSLPGR